MTATAHVEAQGQTMSPPPAALSRNYFGHLVELGDELADSRDMHGAARWWRLAVEHVDSKTESHEVLDEQTRGAYLARCRRAVLYGKADEYRAACTIIEEGWPCK